MRKNELELLKKLIQVTEEGNFYAMKLTFAVVLLTRIRKTYPHIFGECITQEDLNLLMEKYNNDN